MYCGSIQKKRREKEDEERERKELIKDIEYITMRLEQIQESFDLVCESELIDAMIYEEKALKAKYAYLLRLAKEKKIKCRMVIGE